MTHTEYGDFQAVGEINYVLFSKGTLEGKMTSAKINP